MFLKHQQENEATASNSGTSILSNRLTPMDEGQRFGKAWIGKLQLSELKLFQSLVKLAFLEVADDTVCCYFLLVCQPSCCMNV